MALFKNPNSDSLIKDNCVRLLNSLTINISC